ncbi:hypothetical protein LSM04_004982 [Trypanosoma melophagium]|uniref:uncharacterized protein n=1 Tax=Trypanosoma melophagium TaxID=715481 RepID=UPI003519E272|nr:hypothetical protein LSM04_004982 [Trypanosoma melophagium]
MTLHSSPSLSVPLLLLTAITLLAGYCTADPMKLVYVAETVAGVYGEVGTTNGGPGVSMLKNPNALCIGRTDDEILIGDTANFRAFSRRTKETTTLLGTGTAGTVDGTWEIAQVSSPRSCTHTTLTNGDRVVYFVEGGGALRYFNSTNVVSLRLGHDYSFTAVTTNRNMNPNALLTELYMTEQNNDDVWRCVIDDSGVPTGCRSQPKFKADINRYVGIAVTREEIIVAGMGVGFRGLARFTTAGVNTSRYAGDFPDVVALPNGAIYATSVTQLYNVAISKKESSFVLNPFAGDENATCPPVKDGENPTFCENAKLLVIAENEMYVLSTQYFTLRSVILPAVQIPGVLPRPPLPVGFPDEANIMPNIMARMNAALNDRLSTTDTAVGEHSFVVNDTTWRTDFTVLVQQQRFDTDTTWDTVLTTSYSGAEELLREYYDRTNEVVYMDTSIVPFCDSAKIYALEHNVVAVVRNVLQFPRIYADPPEARTINGVANITTMKLLMPETFGNDTTTMLLDSISLTNVSLNVIRELYSPDNIASLTFFSPRFDFSHLTSEQDNELRWKILQKVRERLAMCEKLANPGGTTTTPNSGTGTGGNSNSGSGATGSTGVCEATITNRTSTQVRLRPDITRSEYEVFLPQGLYNFNVTQCLDGSDWGWMEKYLNDHQNDLERSGSKCNRGCIIGVAVASAVVLTALIVLVVVLTSKRRRLAAVVAPPDPKFKSTLDEDEEEMASSNPLQNPAHGN